MEKRDDTLICNTTLLLVFIINVKWPRGRCINAPGSTEPFMGHLVLSEPTTPQIRNTIDLHGVIFNISYIGSAHGPYK